MIEVDKPLEDQPYFI